LAGACAGASENNGSGEAEAGPAIQIHQESLSPTSIEVAQGNSFVFMNSSSSIAIVEFELEEGERIPCNVEDGSQPSGRHLILRSQSSIRCTAVYEGDFDFAVMRSRVWSKGTISVE
jgi:hypothetical protein